MWNVIQYFLMRQVETMLIMRFAVCPTKLRVEIVAKCLGDFMVMQLIK